MDKIRLKLFHLIKKQNILLSYHLLLILLFSLIFYFFAPYSGNDEDMKSYATYFQTLYYTTTTHFTIGFGDITPKSSLLRLSTMIHIFLTFLLFRI